MGWTKVDVHPEQLIGSLAIIEDEIRDLLGEDDPKGEFFVGLQVYFTNGLRDMPCPIMIELDKGVWIFK